MLILPKHAFNFFALWHWMLLLFFSLIIEKKHKRRKDVYNWIEWNIFSKSEATYFFTSFAICSRKKSHFSTLMIMNASRYFKIHINAIRYQLVIWIPYILLYLDLGVIWYSGVNKIWVPISSAIWFIEHIYIFVIVNGSNKNRTNWK